MRWIYGLAVGMLIADGCVPVVVSQPVTRVLHIVVGVLCLIEAYRESTTEACRS
jgi:hypothetical protein